MALKLLHHNHKPPLKHLRFFCNEPSPLNQNVEKIYHIITSSSSSQTLKQTLKSSQIPITNELIEKVLKKIRFSHSNPLQALDFFNFTSQSKDFYHTQFSLNTMLYILGRTRKFDQIWGILSEIKRKDQTLITHRTLQVVLGRIAKVCSVRETVEGFKRFRRLIGEFDTQCYNALFRVLCQEKSMVDARNVYHSLKNQFKPNLFTYNVLLSGWKSTEEAEAFFEEMKEMGVKPDIVSYNSLIDVYCKSGEVKKAYEVFDKMQEEEGVVGDVITYTTLIGGLGKAGQPDKARELLREMKEFGVYPDVAAYNAAIRNYCIAKRLGNAYELVREMEEKGLSPNSTTFNLFFRVFYWSNDLKSSWVLYRHMKKVGCLPNTQSCMFLIRLCKRQEKPEMALELWNDMVEKGFGSYTLFSDVLFDLLCDLGMLDDAEKCFFQMVEKGQKPSNLSFRRIKVLMELANKHENLKKLSEKMAIFGSPLNVRRPSENFDDATTLRSIAR